MAIRPRGPLGARIVLIGEFPTAEADNAGQPFYGYQSTMLETWLRQSGIMYKDCYVTAVLKNRPDRGKPETVEEAEKYGWFEMLKAELTLLTNPAPILVPLGPLALEAVTGKTNIYHWRGSIMFMDCPKRGKLRVIPSHAPAAVIIQPELTKPVLRDCHLIAQQAKVNESSIPERHAIMFPVEADCRMFVEELNDLATDPATVLSIDIETNPKELDIICVGVGFKEHEALVLPWKPQYVPWIKTICAHPVLKVMQGGWYDSYWLHFFGVPVVGYFWDTMCLHHMLYPTEPHSMAYQQSLYTRQPYHKGMTKTDNEKTMKIGGRIEVMYAYNAIDVGVTLELMHRYHEKMSKELFDFYARHYGNLLPVLVDMMITGIAVDGAYRAESHESQQKKILTLREQLKEEAGFDLFGEKAISPKKLAKFLYEVKGMPKKYKVPSPKTGKTSLVTDEVQIRTLMERFPNDFATAGKMLLDVKRTKQLNTFFAENRVDPDGRMRSTYRPTTEAARLASSSNPFDTGANLQNIDREARELFIPDTFE